MVKNEKYSVVTVRFEKNEKKKKEEATMNTSVEVTSEDTTATVNSNLQESDPWMKAKFSEAPEAADEANAEDNAEDVPPTNPETKEI